MFITREEQRQSEQEHIVNFLEYKMEFVMIPDHVIFSDKLTDGEKLFFIKLYVLSDKTKGTLYHSNDTLAEKFGYSLSNVTKHLQALKKKKAIDVLSISKFKTRVICLTPWNLI